MGICAPTKYILQPILPLSLSLSRSLSVAASTPHASPMSMRLNLGYAPGACVFVAHVCMCACCASTCSYAAYSTYTIFPTVPTQHPSVLANQPNAKYDHADDIIVSAEILRCLSGPGYNTASLLLHPSDNVFAVVVVALFRTAFPELHGPDGTSRAPSARAPFVCAPYTLGMMVGGACECWCVSAYTQMWGWMLRGVHVIRVV